MFTYSDMPPSLLAASSTVDKAPSEFSFSVPASSSANDDATAAPSSFLPLLLRSTEGRGGAPWGDGGANLAEVSRGAGALPRFAAGGGDRVRLCLDGLLLLVAVVLPTALEFSEFLRRPSFGGKLDDV